jgi:hypothetical protein
MPAAAVEVVKKPLLIKLLPLILAAAFQACAAERTSTSFSAGRVASAATAGAPSSDTFESWDAIRLGNYRMSVNAVYYGYHSGDFSIGSFKEPWDSGNRGELDIMYHLDIQYGHVEPVLGGYFFYESREWSEGDANVDNDVVGFGVEAAAILYPMKNPDKRDFTVGLMPYTRLGFGWQDGTFRNVPTAKGFSTGDVNPERGEVTFGLDLRATLHDSLMVAAGPALNLWYASSADAVTRDQTGVIVEEEDRLDFDGNEVVFRVSVGFKF